MALTRFDPARVLGSKITGMSQQGLCEFASKLCGRIEAEVGSKSYRGGIFPENISVDEDGNIGIGPASVGNWAGQELEFLAPELYWRSNPTAASDVYSVGMVMYYALNGGKLPYDGECEDAQLRRMGGEDFKAPKGTGRRLKDIVEKAVKFKAQERYQSLGEMQAAIDSCIKNLYLSGETSAEAIFNKSDDDLSELERMMVGIIEKSDEAPAEEQDGEEPAEEVKVYAPSTPIADAKAAARARASDPAQVIARRFKEQGSPAVPKLREEKNPELAPIVPSRQPVKTPPVQYTRNMEREKKIAEDVKKRRRRPLAVILVLCAALIVVAIIFNAMLKDFRQARANSSPSPAVTDADPFAGTMDPANTTDPNDPYGYFSEDGEEDENAPAASATPEPSETPREHGYELVIEDVSWTEAAEKCKEMGGHLVTINTQDEFDTVVKMAEEAGVPRIWIGCHRVDGELVWENDETGIEVWAKGEPSYVDINDQVAEDYIMLWDNNGWGYNDNRNDPIADYPEWYSGTVGFICEYGD